MIPQAGTERAASDPYQATVILGCLPPHFVNLGHIRIPEIRMSDLGQWHGAVLLSLAVVQRQDLHIQIQVLDPELQAFEQPQAAPVKQLPHQVVG